MKIYLVRHGQTTHNRDGIRQGQYDTRLTDLGIKQAKNIADRLKEHKFDMIYSSDLTRAHDTTKQITKHHKNEIILDKRLRERCVGIFQNKKREEIDFDSLPGDYWNQRPPEGESFIDQINRVKEFVKELDDKDHTLIVSHGGTIRALLHVFLDIELDRLKEVKHSKNTALYILEKKDDEFKLILDNCDKHNQNL